MRRRAIREEAAATCRDSDLPGVKDGRRERPEWTRPQSVDPPACLAQRG